MTTTRKNYRPTVNDSQNPYEGREGLIYARVSSKRQVLEGSGLESQEGRCINDLESIRVPYSRSFLDSYSGGGDFMKRPAMSELLGYIDANPHRKFVVVFDDLKRFARDTEFHLKLRAAFRARDVVLRCLNFKLEDTPEGKHIEVIMAAGAELEREQNKRQVVQKQTARLLLGYWAFPCKRGYKFEKTPIHGKLSVPVKKDAEILKIALEGFSTGIFPRKIDVCAFLVEKGFWKKQAPDRYISKLNNILNDPFYAGYIHYPTRGIEWIPGKHKAIISLETYERIQLRLKKGDRPIRVRKDLSEIFPLRGLILCTSCDRPLTAATSKGRSKPYDYYYCQTGLCPLRYKIYHKNVVEDSFEKKLKEQGIKTEVGEFVSLVFNRSWESELKDYYGKEKRRELRTKYLQERITTCSDLAITAKSDSVRGAYESELDKAVKELEALEAKAAKKTDIKIPYRTALEKSTEMLKNPYSVWERVDVHERHRLFFFIFEKKLEYDKNEGYRTAESLSAKRLFETIADQKHLDVEVGGMIPRPNPALRANLRRVVSIEVST